MKSVVPAFLVMLAASCVQGAAGLTPMTWSSFTPTSATGDLNGITVTATTSAGSPIVGISGGWFGKQWDGSMPLGDDALGLVVSSVNAGDWQNFSFSSPLLDGTVMYIENFDSSSIALMTFSGATGTTLVDASQSIAYGGIGEYGLMVTSNSGFDGEGDAAIRLDGDVTEVNILYARGEGANGVMYSFAAPEANAVPEPTMAAVMAGLFGFGAVFYWRRK